ncbi:MAG: agmatine deiminase family protein [Rickettsiales bacterium]|nr:agmatine deiminase family protein [Rickettsiales bacterium]
MPMRMPAEWEKQDATWLSWPHNAEDWPDKFGPIPWAYTEIVRLIAKGQKVKLLMPKALKKEALEIFARAHVNMANVQLLHVATDRGWMRDCGPIYVYDGKKKVMLDWGFTGWAKYDNHQADDKVPGAVSKLEKIPAVVPMHKGKRVVLEGGSIDVNGKGTLLTTEECLLSKVQERNPGMKRDDYEAVFEKYLGITNTIWLGDGIDGDDTHGHVDDLSRFVNPTTVVTAVEKNKKDVNYARLQDNLKRLKKARDQSGKPLDVVELPMPGTIPFEDMHLPASYANFLICNHAVLVPTFNDVNDRVALSILAELFPKREVVGIHALDLVWGLGTIHCLSQQEPAGKAA